MKRKLFMACTVAFATFTCLSAPLGTAFTYQGRLHESDASANGLYDFEFALVGEPEASTPTLG